MTIWKCAVFVGIAGGLLSSCGSSNQGLQRLGVRVHARHASVLLVDARVSRRANQNRPVSADLVLVYSEELLAELLALSGQDWFDRREQKRSDHKGDMDVFAWEWVPGQIVPVQAVPLSRRVIAGLLFADYSSPGDHRTKIDPRKTVTIEFLERDFSVGPMK